MKRNAYFSNGQVCRLVVVEWTIDELARAVDMTARNIREWQTNGLVDPPERRGRIGVYTGSHLARIKRIQKLRTEGFPLDLIRRILAAPERPAAEVHRVAEVALTPFTSSDARTVDRAELEGLLGAGAQDGLAALGLVTSADADTVTVEDPELLDLLTTVVRLGIPLPDVAGAFHAAQGPLREVAGIFTSAFVRPLWQPLAAA